VPAIASVDVLSTPSPSIDWGPCAGLMTGVIRPCCYQWCYRERRGVMPSQLTPIMNWSDHDIDEQYKR
jgi:hypothetical protein